MTRALRFLAMALALGGMLVASWRIVGQMRAERHAADEPVRALQWRSNYPQALLALAQVQLARGDAAAAQASARQLLAHEPLQGIAFGVLAAAAEQHGDQAKAFRLYRIAERRAPRDLPTRAWLTRHYLTQGEFAQALVQIDRILRMSPQHAGSIHPVLVQMAEKPEFADALATSLRQNPPWRPGIIAALRAAGAGNQRAAGRVMQALQNQGGLRPEEYARWLDSLMAQGRWGEAYARWAGRVPKTAGRLPSIYNGDFALPQSNVGFDWRLRRVPGVLLQFEPAAGIAGQAAYFRFLDRRVPNAGLEQPLLLREGRYRLSMRIRAQGLRSEMGLQWVVACASGKVVARTEAMDGSFGWRTLETDVIIPASGCAGQWLRLVNPVPAGAAQRVTGELWVTDVKAIPQR